jgi:hypothetical protein
MNVVTERVGKFLDQLNDYQLFTWNSVARKSFFNALATFREQDRKFYFI